MILLIVGHTILITPINRTRKTDEGIIKVRYIHLFILRYYTKKLLDRFARKMIGIFWRRFVAIKSAVFNPDP